MLQCDLWMSVTRRCPDVGIYSINKVTFPSLAQVIMRKKRKSAAITSIRRCETFAIHVKKNWYRCKDHENDRLSCCTIIIRVNLNLRFVEMMEESVTTFETHLTAVMDSLIRASVCEITKLFQETVNDYLVEMSLNRKENDALKLRLKLTESKLRTERKYGLGWAAGRRSAGLAPAEDGVGGRQKRKVEVASECLCWIPLSPLLCVMLQAAARMKSHLAAFPACGQSL